VDPYSAVAAGVAALYGPLHGAPTRPPSSRDVARIETVENIPDFLEGVKAGDERLMGFGHRVSTRNYDPRARINPQIPSTMCSRCGGKAHCSMWPRSSRSGRSTTSTSPRAKLYPNVDFYSGLIYEALGCPWPCSR